MRKFLASPDPSKPSRTKKTVVILSGAKDLLLLAAFLLPLFSCSQPLDRNTLVMIIESSPTNLDPRVGIAEEKVRAPEHVVGGALDLGLAPLAGLEQHTRVRPRGERPTVHGVGQRRSGQRRLDQHAVPGRHLEAVLDDEPGVEVVEGVHQTSSRPPSTTGRPSASIEPPWRRSQMRSQWTAERFSPPSSGNAAPSAV